MPDPLALHISSLTFSDGTAVQLPENGTLALVGPNNVGKSAALREIRGILEDNPPGLVVTGIELVKAGDDGALFEWLKQHCQEREHEPGRFAYGRPFTNFEPLEALQQWWRQHDPNRLSRAAGFFTLHLRAESRFELAGPRSSYDAMRDVPTEAMHLLFAQPDKEVLLADAVQSAFGTRLTLNRVGGMSMGLLFGATDVEGTLPPSEEYLSALRALPVLESQGDGVRAFAGIMLALIAARYPLVLLDEPEAFLHPPQARLIGRSIARHSHDSQVLLATHSIDVLQGLLDDPETDVMVARIERKGVTNEVSVLSAPDVRRLWTDPLLRSSRILDGLFHAGVVVCEADSDTRFYQALLDARDEHSERPHDLLFTDCGGNGRIPQAVTALQAVRVPVRVIADFDTIRNADLFKKLVQALGGTWDDIESDWRKVHNALSIGRGTLKTAAVRETVGSVLSQAGPDFTRDDRAAIERAMKARTPWDEAKERGLGGVPPGDAYAAGARLLDDLKSIGLFLVPVGQLESWFQGIGNHGPPWTSAALIAKLHEDPTTPASCFVHEVASSFRATEDVA